MKRFLLTFVGSALAGAVLAYFLTLHFKTQPVVHLRGIDIPIQTKEGLFVRKDFFVALGSAAAFAALAATLASWLLFSSPRRRRRK
jgi:hypothetical protein